MRGSLVIALALLLILPGAALLLSGMMGRVVPQPVVATTASAPAALSAPAPAPDQVAAPSPPTGPVAPPSTRGAPADETAPWAAAALLEDAVKQAMADFPGTYSIAVQALEGGQRWTLNPDQRYHPASTIKMPVALYTLEQYRAGKLSWQEMIEYTPADFETPGGGAFEEVEFGGLYPVDNLVSRALRYSNNVAVNMLGRHLGWANIEAWTKRIDGDLDRVNGSPRVTALSALGWWLHLHKLSLEDPQHAELLLTPLRLVEYNGRITAGLPEGVPHLHKFGSYDGNYHDTGIIYAKQPYILIVLTHGAEVDQADAAIARLSAAIFAIMNAGEA